MRTTGICSALDGPSEVAARYPSYSALHFAPEALEVALGEFRRNESFHSLYGTLQTYEERLQPVVSAPVLPFGRTPGQAMPMPHEPMEMMNKQAA